MTPELNIHPDMSVSEASARWNRFMVDVYAQIDATRDEQKAKAGKRDNVFARFKKMWRDSYRKRIDAEAEKRMADHYNKTAANPNLSPHEREAIERWKAGRW